MEAFSDLLEETEKWRIIHYTSYFVNENKRKEVKCLKQIFRIIMLPSFFDFSTTGQE